MKGRFLVWLAVGVLCSIVCTVPAMGAVLLDDQFGAVNGTSLDGSKWTDVYGYAQKDGQAWLDNGTDGSFASIASFGSASGTVTWEALGTTFGSDFSGRAWWGLWTYVSGVGVQGVALAVDSYGPGLLRVALFDRWGTEAYLTSGTPYDFRVAWTPVTNSVKYEYKTSASETWSTFFELNNRPDSDVPGEEKTYQFSVSSGTSNPDFDRIRVYDDTVVPEPSGMLTLLFGGASVLGYAVRRRR